MVMSMTWLLSLDVAYCAENSETSLFDKLFIPLPPRTEIKRNLRRQPFVKQQLTIIVEDAPAKPEPIDWQAIYRTLPRDDEEVVDWMKALTDKLINPKPGIDPKAENWDPEDAEVEFIPKKKSLVIFRHATHTQWLTCKNCHPAIFKKKADNMQFTHDDMDDRKYCGVCHDKVVFLQSGCNACHAKKKS